MSGLVFLSIAIALSLLQVVARAAPAHNGPAPRWTATAFCLHLMTLIRLFFAPLALAAKKREDYTAVLTCWPRTEDAFNNLRREGASTRLEAAVAPFVKDEWATSHLFARKYLAKNDVVIARLVNCGHAATELGRGFLQ